MWRAICTAARMHQRTLAITAAGLVLLASSTVVRSQQDTAPSPVLALMLGTMVPASEVIFSAPAEPPKTQADWAAMQKAAETLIESGRQLAQPPLARSEPDWKELTQAFIVASQGARAAAVKRSEDALSEAGDDVYAACDTCHRRILPGPR
jgi:hypothetical protein